MARLLRAARGHPQRKVGQVIGLNVSANINRVKLELKATSDAIEQKALVRALNRSGQSVITEAPREVAKTYNLKIAVIKRQMRLHRAHPGKLSAIVRIFGKRIPLIEFSARQTRAGVTVNVKHQRKTIRGAFIRTMASGHKGVFVRAPNSIGQARAKFAFRRGKGSRIAPLGQNDLPIAQLFALSVPAAFLERAVMAATKKAAVASFEKNFKQQMTFLNRAR